MLEMEEFIGQCKSFVETVPYEEYMRQGIERGHGALLRVPYYLKQIPSDMLWSMGLGVVACGVFLKFGNTKKPLIKDFSVDGRHRTQADTTEENEEEETSRKLANLAAAVSGTDSSPKSLSISSEAHGGKTETDADLAEPSQVSGQETAKDKKSNKKKSESKHASKALNSDTDSNSAAENTLSGAPPQQQKLTGKLTDEEGRVLEKLRKLQQDWNVSDETLRKAINETASQHSRGINSVGMARNMDGDAVSWLRMLDGVVLFALLAIGAYWLNVTTQGNAGRVLCSMFPRELRTLGLYDMLQQFGS